VSKKRKTIIKRGKFYASYPNGGHPSLIYSKHRRKNKYDAVVFGTTPGHHRKEMNVPISNNIEKSVVHTRPIRGVRPDFSDKELVGLRIDKSDKTIVEIIKRKKPQETRKYKLYKEKKRQAS
jgi:hypothetical protein